MRILAIDLGTSAVKLMRVDERATILSVDRAPAEDLSVERWIETLEVNLARHGDQREIGGIVVTGQMHGLMTREDDRWGEGIPWHDGRSASIIPTLRDALGPDAITTCGGPLAAGFQAASLAWLREHDRDRWKRITSIHLPKDALIQALTGDRVTDSSDAAGTGMYAPAAGDWAWDVVDALRIPRDWLPRLMPAGSIAGGLRPEQALRLGLPRGLPIMLGGGDAPAGAYGAGVRHDSEALVMLSTGAQVILPARTWAPDPRGRWYTWPSVAPEGSDDAPYLRTGTLMNAGNVTRWAESVLAEGAIDDGPGPIVALPHLIGTRERPDLRGAVFGLDEGTSAGDIRRALLEGVAFSIRAKVDAMTGAGAPPARIRLGGGLAHRPHVRQLFADALGVPIETVSQPETTAYGAALLALSTLTGQVPEAPSASAETSVPNAGTRDAYTELYALWRDLDDAMSPLATRLAAIRTSSR